MTRRAAPPKLPARPRDGHKGTFGRVLIVAGSRDMPGAAALATLGALRGGAGLVTLAAPASAIDRVAAAVPCATFASLPESRDGLVGHATATSIVTRRAADSDVVVIGPGLGPAGKISRALSRWMRTIDRPMVIDADGLNALALDVNLVAGRPAPTVLTPHPGEFARLDQGDTPCDASSRKTRCEALATRLGAVICLKGAGTVVTDGRSTYINSTGNPGMATGGSGDVLSGLLAALWAQLGDPLPSSIAAVRLHGIAGDLAARARSQESLIATDLLEHLGAAFRTYRRPPKRKSGGVNRP